MQTMTTRVIDTNRIDQGDVLIGVEMIKGIPDQVLHKGRVFYQSRLGRSVSNGKPMVELADDADNRIWMDYAGGTLFED